MTAANGSAEPGLSRRRVRELADWYSDEGHQRYCDNTLDTAALDAELRAALAEEVFPEFVEIEFERVMKGGRLLFVTLEVGGRGSRTILRGLRLHLRRGGFESIDPRCGGRER